jgi:hypothetical protein
MTGSASNPESKDSLMCNKDEKKWSRLVKESGVEQE